MFGKEKHAHLFYYSSLGAILVTGLITVYFATDRMFQLTTLTLTVLIYVIWGIIHHLLHHDLTAKIVVEYVLMGALAQAIIFLIYKGGFGL